MIELIKDHNLKKKQTSVVTKSPEEQLNYKNKELENQDQMTRNLYQEMERLQRQAEHIGDPLYMSQLKRQQMELDAQVRTMTKDIKTLQQEQYRREKRLEKIIKDGEPESFKDVQQ